jgi:hypothetical protein
LAPTDQELLRRVYFRSFEKMKAAQQTELERLLKSLEKNVKKPIAITEQRHPHGEKI